MNSTEYKRHYGDFLLSMFRAEVITFYADSTIPLTEVNQPESDKYRLAFFVSFSRCSLGQVGGGYRSDDKIIKTFGGMAFDTRKEELISYHELPVALAHLEAFLNHSLVALWESDRTLLAKVNGYERYLKKGGLSANPADWSQAELDELMEKSALDIFFSSFTGFYEYTKLIGVPVSGDIRQLQLAFLERNLIIHNGGIVNDKFLHLVKVKGLNDRGFVKGHPVPMNYAYIVAVSNQARQIAEELFNTISQQFLGISKPIEDFERGYSRQDLDQQVNPAREAAEKAVRKLGGADAYLAYRTKLAAEGMSKAQIDMHIIQLGLSD